MVSTGKRADVALMAHLSRRAGFGATRAELDHYLAQGYDATVEEFLNPGDPQAMPTDLIRRYHVDQSTLRVPPSASANWMYRLVTTHCSLQEKIALFWHRVFATGQTKLIQGKVIHTQLDMFRKYGLGSFREILIQLSKDPAMILWLDNEDNHKGAINENYGREILELFSMGVGHYTEQDIKEAARAFTGWTITNPDYMAVRMRNNSQRPYGYIAWQFEYRSDDHDDGEKTFLGETGSFDGEDVIDIICKQPATAQFIARHLCHFFVADEAPVPQWPYVPPRDPELIDLMSQAYFDSGYRIDAMLRAVFQSEAFKSGRTRHARIKSPAELVVGVMRLAGGWDWPTMESYEAAQVCGYAGQALLNPPSVEGWMGGPDWINTGALVHRINFASKIFGDAQRSGIRDILDHIRAQATDGMIEPKRLVDLCLDAVGPLDVSEATRSDLVEYANSQGTVRLADVQESERKILTVLQLVVTTREFQLA